MQKAVSGMRSGFEPLFAAFSPIFPSALLNFLSDFKGALFLYDEFSDCFQLVFREILAPSCRSFRYSYRPAPFFIS